MPNPPRRDIFPTTARSWIDGQLGRGAQGWAETNHHIMSMYAEPLKVYYNGSSFRSMGEPDDVIASFFVDRLGRKDFLEKWQASERRLRHWMIVAFRYFLMEQRAVRQLPMERNASHAFGDDSQNAVAVATGGKNPEHIFHREVARSIVHKAVATTEERCEADGLSIHWCVWVGHVIDGLSFPELSKEFDGSIVRLKVMSRTVNNRFRQTLRELIAWSGATPQQLDEEIQELIRNLAKDNES